MLVVVAKLGRLLRLTFGVLRRLRLMRRRRDGGRERMGEVFIKRIESVGYAGTFHGSVRGWEKVIL